VEFCGFPGSAMDIIDFSLKMRRLVQWLDGCCPPDSFIRKRFDRPPFGNCYVTIDLDRQALFASANMNRVYLCATDAGMDAGSIRHLIDLFAGEGIKRFFVWLSPGPDTRLARGGRAVTDPAHRLSDAMPHRPAPDRLRDRGVRDTLYAEHSWRNLQRAGFREAYEKEVYEWNALSA
jgi:hypothetical protein